jgi:large repetitive protein
MTATNGAGTSAGSGLSNPVVPLVAQPPSAPLITSILPRNGGLVVDWAAPGIDGGDALTGYTLTITAGSSTTKEANATATGRTAEPSWARRSRQ